MKVDSSFDKHGHSSNDGHKGDDTESGVMKIGKRVPNSVNSLDTGNGDEKLDELESVTPWK